MYLDLVFMQSHLYDLVFRTSDYTDGASDSFPISGWAVCFYITALGSTQPNRGVGVV